MGTSKKRRKLIDSFLGYVLTLKFAPSAFRDVQDGYVTSFSPFEVDGETQFLAYQLESKRIVLKKVYDFLGDVIDEKQIDKLLLQHATNCIEEGYVLNGTEDIPQIRDEADNFIASLSAQLHPWRVFVPLQGLRVQVAFQVGRCTLHPVNNSQLLEVLNVLDEHIQTDNFSDEIRQETTSYFTYDTESNVSKEVAERQALNEADLSLDLVRLFLSSNYFHEHNRTVKRRFGILGTVNTSRIKLLVSIRTDVQGLQNLQFGTKSTFTPNDPIDVTSDVLENMQRLGLAEINRRLTSPIGTPAPAEEAKQMTERLLRAITWFSKGTSSVRIADSFLSYAIAIECLFSEGRTSENKYSEYVATVTSNHDANNNEPLRWRLSKSFSERFEDASPFELAVKERFDALFKIRNKIAHGAIFDHDINPLDLLDFETMVNNTILAVIAGTWETLSDFKTWHSQHTMFTSPKKSIWRRLINMICNLAN